MPLLDHFHEPRNPRSRWQPFHGLWAANIVRYLNRTLPDRFFASMNLQLGTEIVADIAEADDGTASSDSGCLAVETLAPPVATGSWLAEIADDLELRWRSRFDVPLKGLLGAS